MEAFLFRSCVILVAMTGREKDHSGGWCARCGGLIPVRSDPRGRRARFCSGACRTAAHREKLARQQEAAVVQARSQLMLEMRSDDQRRKDAVAVIDELAEDLSSALCVGTRHVDVLKAAQRLVDVAVSLDPVGIDRSVQQALVRAHRVGVFGGLTRQQRRAREREHQKKNRR